MRRLSVLIVVLSLLAVACGGLKKIPLTDAQKVYQGYWVSGTNFIEIFPDGSANLQDRGTKVTNGPIRFVENKIEIKLFGIGKEYSIDKAPAKDGSRWKMTLSGVEYTKK